MDKKERLLEYRKNHRPSCFGLEHGMKVYCKSCPHSTDCKNMSYDGENPEPLPSRMDD